jgi:hypothetical protein
MNAMYGLCRGLATSASLLIPIFVAAGFQTDEWTRLAISIAVMAVAVAVVLYGRWAIRYSYRSQIRSGTTLVLWGPTSRRADRCFIGRSRHAPVASHEGARAGRSNSQAYRRSALEPTKAGVTHLRPPSARQARRGSPRRRADGVGGQRAPRY